MTDVAASLALESVLGAGSVVRPDDPTQADPEDFDAVRDLLVAAGLDRAQIETAGRGEREPLVPTADEVADPQKLHIRTWVDGDLRQDASTELMITGVYELISFMSTAFTLPPGTIIATGTPAGVGFVMKPPRCVSPGMTVKITIDGIGTIVQCLAHGGQGVFRRHHGAASVGDDGDVANGAGAGGCGHGLRLSLRCRIDPFRVAWGVRSPASAKFGHAPSTAPGTSAKLLPGNRRL